jgi:hypothetical protein
VTRARSHDFELQRQRCKNLQRLSSLVRFEKKQKYFLLLWINALAYYKVGDVVVFKVVKNRPQWRPSCSIKLYLAASAVDRQPAVTDV